MSFLAKEAGKQGKRFAGKVLDEFLTGLAAKGAEKAYNYLYRTKSYSNSHWWFDATGRCRQDLRRRK